MIILWVISPFALAELVNFGDGGYSAGSGKRELAIPEIDKNDRSEEIKPLLPQKGQGQKMDKASMLARLGKQSPAATSHNLKFRNIVHENLLKIGQVWDISEDQHGFIWIAAARGLARFDGINVKIFQYDINNSNSIPEGYVSDILHSKNGDVWVATRSGLYQFLPDKERFIHTPLFAQNYGAIQIVWSLAEDSHGNIWVAFSGGGIGRYTPETGEFQRIVSASRSKNFEQIQNTYVIFVDSDDQVWSGTEAGVSVYDQQSQETRFYTHSTSHLEAGQKVQISTTSLTAGTITSIAEDHQGNIWIGSSEGLSRFDKNNQTFYSYQHDRNLSNSLSGNIIGDIVVDKQGQIWVATDGSGLNLYLPKDNVFKRFYANEQTSGSILNDSVRRAFVTEDGDLWLGYHPYGVSVSDRYASAFLNFSHSSQNPKSLSSSTVYALHQPGPDQLWVGTEKGFNHIQLSSGEITRYLHDPSNSNSLSANAVLSIFEDTQGRVWAGTWSGGLNMYNPLTRQFRHYFNKPDDINSLPNNNVWIVKERDPKHLWVGTEKGLSLFNLEAETFTPIEGFDSRVGNIVVYDKNYIIVVDDNRMSIVNQETLKRENSPVEWSQLPRIINAHVSEKGELWIATEQGFMYQSQLGARVDYFTRAGDAAKQYYSQLVSDRQGLIWLGNSNGITSYNSELDRFTFFNSNHGLPGDSFRAARAAILLSDGRVAMGGAEGLSIFDSKATDQLSYPITPILTGLKILDQKVNLDSPGAPIESVISLANHINLSYRQNVFSIEYSAIDYQLAALNNFKFRLRGFDQNWRLVGSQRVATYTNLDPGNYVFEVTVGNDQDIWSLHPASINISVQPPWWLTWRAYLLYALISLLFIGLVLYGFWLNSQRAHERRVNRKLMEVDQLKNEFMAKTSHELRTPLNGIIGLTEAIIAGDAGPISVRIQERLKIVVSSGKRLSNIINDILDFSKLRDHEINLNKTQFHLNDIVESVLVLSQALVGNKDLKLINKVDPNLPRVYADEQRIVQVLFNLVGNAIKFTDQGKVSVWAEHNELATFVYVKDSGQGIEKEDEERIFKPFEQSSSNNLQHIGTGLGLAVSKQLIELHGGNMGLKSHEGRGAIFYFSLPIMDAINHELNEGASPLLSNPLDVQSTFFEQAPKALPSVFNKNPSAHTYRVLIVDDEPVNRLVLQGFLGVENFEAVEVESGKQAIKLLRSGEKFDLVLLDVMMPDLSGYDTCEIIRQSYPITELPIIFLTAKSQLEDMQKAYQSGANDFLYKPVVREEFLAKVNMQIQLYAQLKQKHLSKDTKAS